MLFKLKKFHYFIFRIIWHISSWKWNLSFRKLEPIIFTSIKLEKSTSFFFIWLFILLKTLINFVYNEEIKIHWKWYKFWPKRSSKKKMILGHYFNLGYLTWCSVRKTIKIIKWIRNGKLKFKIKGHRISIKSEFCSLQNLNYSGKKTWNIFGANSCKSRLAPKTLPVFFRIITGSALKLNFWSLKTRNSVLVLILCSVV